MAVNEVGPTPNKYTAKIDRAIFKPVRHCASIAPD
jgi:hypothetical protein